MGIWSKVPYWLKGGILLLVIMAVLNIPLIIMGFTGFCQGSDGSQTSLCNFLVLIGFTPGVILSFFIPRVEEGQLVIIVSFVVYFLLGAIVGFILGMGKNKSMPKPKSMAEVEERFKDMEG